MFLVDLSHEKEKKCVCWVGIRGKEGRGRPDVSETERYPCVFSWFGCCSPPGPLGLTWALVPGSWSWGSCPPSPSRVAGQSVQGSKFKAVKV